MNNTEFVELLEREHKARTEFGSTRNDYVCAECLRAAKSEAGATFTNWPAFVDADGKAYCDEHASSST